MICDKVRHGVFWKAGKRLLAQPPKCVGGFLGHQKAALAASCVFQYYRGAHHIRVPIQNRDVCNEKMCINKNGQPTSILNWPRSAATFYKMTCSTFSSILSITIRQNLVNYQKLSQRPSLSLIALYKTLQFCPEVRLQKLLKKFENPCY